MSGRLLKRSLTAVVTVGLIGASAFVGAPLAMFAIVFLIGRVFNAPATESVFYDVWVFASACMIWWAAAAWLAGIGGRFRRFTLRGLLISMSIATLYMGLTAIVAPPLM